MIQTKLDKFRIKQALVLSSTLIAALGSSAYAADADIWQQYTGVISSPTIPVLPDYSYAGYKLGMEGIPENHTLDVFNVTDYGAIANDLVSDQNAIQLAIDTAEANGGGVVFFPAGEFLVNTDAESTSTIQISSSNIILKGSGSTPGGTIIKMQNHMLLPDGAQPWATPNMITYSIPSSTNAITSITQDESRGSTIIHVTDANIFAGEKYLRLKMTANLTANSDYLDNRTPNSVWSAINDNGVELSEFHQIVAINSTDNTITLKDPVVDDIDASLNWTAEPYTMMENIGFEDIHFKGNFTDNFVHHKDYIHDYGWHAVSMVRAANSWVTRSRFTNVTRPVGMSLSYASSIHTILADGNGGHALTNIGGSSSRILQGLIWDNTSNGFYHGADMSGRANGSVTWRVEAEMGNGWDLHAAQPRTNLIDNYASAGISSSGGHYSNNPNHLTGLTIWNQSATEAETADPVNFWPGECGSNYCGTTLVSPTIVGYHGNDTTFAAASLKYQESTGSKVSPESLYEAQLAHRSVVGIPVPVIEDPVVEEPVTQTETFTNMTITSWGAETYVGDNGNTWSINGSGSGTFVDGTKGLYFQIPENGPVLAVESGTISGGISSFSIDLIDKWDAGDERTLELLINGDVIATSTHTGTEVYTFTVNDINIAGDFIIGIQNVSAGAEKTHSIAVDNISWVSFASNEPPVIEPPLVTQTETFTNMTLTTWGAETYVGDNGITWSIDGSGSGTFVNGTKSLYFQIPENGPVLAVESGTISGGISSFSIDLIDKWDAGDERTLELLINGDVIATSTHTGTEVYTFTVNDINIAGDFIIGIQNVSAGAEKTHSIAVDNISWVSFASNEPDWTVAAKAQFDTMKTNWYAAGIPVTGISMAQASAQIIAGQFLTLSAMVTPSYATDTSIVWSSSDPAIATVDAGGLVKALSSGSVTITATTNDGNFTATTVITSVEEQSKETFSNLALDGWGTETYVGANDIEWTVNAKGVTEYLNPSKHIYFQGNPSKPRFIAIQSGLISGGISSFSAPAKDLWSEGNERTLELLINGEVVDTFTHTGEDEYTYQVNDINIEGDFTLAIQNMSTGEGDNAVAIDNMTWKPYSGGTTEPGETGEPEQPTNVAPIAYAGTLQSIVLPSDKVNLSGACNDDDLPSTDAKTCTWSGPEGVTFADVNSAETIASFAAAGTYVLTLTANDGELTTTDKVTIMVNAEVPNEDKASSGGGSMGYMLFTLILLARRKLTK
ncbi:DUF4955 domain-containing protein [Thalassotalea fonticola]|uniref:DUF4955 domain-containing protein n=1 Tax=Thalassotalea fonticola TaxID=3065649 RepID=A0ABZ0GK80_9GAMM|nr:DUF4955 domain-containing protein [Colwelliaceae bacterium S1-1]